MCECPSRGAEPELGCNRHLDESACVTAAVGAVTAHETPNETPRCRSARERHAIVRGVMTATVNLGTNSDNRHFH
ncbi:hypothetical protein PGT21_028095 [Puccinia graminis f. sp. tritici]|uniref:Uncharacterized protein n=1 Tax=Puccinia graminis f. sp. tritici TaxID=56615 RepID=A0A5B0MG11_PUCGR|nr:hypothetical protein PGT21_028095 [Puccinia graminis f. sp. tritici]